MPRLALILAAALVAAPALAQTAPPPANPMLHDETRADAEARANAMFARMDLNGDGAITLDEIGAVLAARSGAVRGGKMPAASPMAKAMFDDADTDHDGRITSAESKAAADRGFDETDTDHDGIVSPAERLAAAQEVTKPSPVAGRPKSQDGGR